MTVKEDCLCSAILYLHAFKQNTTPRYCPYAASLTYTLKKRIFPRTHQKCSVDGKSFQMSSNAKKSNKKIYGT